MTFEDKINNLFDDPDDVRALLRALSSIVDSGNAASTMEKDLQKIDKILRQ